MSKDEAPTAAKGVATPDLNDLFGIDEDLADNGVWVQFGGFGFKLKHSDPMSSKYQAIRERVTRPYRQQIERNTLDPKVDRRLAVSIFVEAFLVDWRTQTLDDDSAVVATSPNLMVSGDALPFTKENAIGVLCKLPKLFQNLSLEGANIANYRQPDKDGDRKNS